MLGDMDCLFKGPTLYLLLERKRRVQGEGGAQGVVSQVQFTAFNYK